MTVWGVALTCSPLFPTASGIRLAPCILDTPALSYISSLRPIFYVNILEEVFINIPGHLQIHQSTAYKTNSVHLLGLKTRSHIIRQFKSLSYVSLFKNACVSVLCVTMCMHVPVGLCTHAWAYGDQRRTPSAFLSTSFPWGCISHWTLYLQAQLTWLGLGFALGALGVSLSLLPH